MTKDSASRKDRIKACQDARFKRFTDNYDEMNRLGEEILASIDLEGLIQCDKRTIARYRMARRFYLRNKRAWDEMRAERLLIDVAESCLALEMDPRGIIERILPEEHP